MSGVRHWFRREVEDRLRGVVGGSARLRVVVLLACVLALDAADKATIGATAAQLEQALGIGNTQIGLLVAVSTGIGALATLPVGALTDRVNRTNLLVGAIVAWSVAMVVSGTATSYLMLLLTRLALGAIVATASPTVTSLIGDLFPAAERGRIYGFILSGELVGTAIGFLVSGDVAAVLSWRYSFWVLAVPGFVLAVAIWRLLPEPARGGQSRLQVGDAQLRPARQVEDRTPTDPGAKDAGEGARSGEPGTAEGEIQREVKEAGVRPHEALVLHTDPTDRSLWWAVRYVLSVRTNVYLIIASALGYFFFAGLRTFAVVFLRGRFGLGQGVASSLLVLIGVGAIVGVLVAGPVSDRLVAHHHITGRPLVGGIAFIVAAVLFLPGLLTTSLLLAAPLFFLAAAGVGGANPSLDAARLDLMHSRLWGRAESVRTVLRSSLEAVAPLLFGYVSSLFGGNGAGFGQPGGVEQRGAVGLDHTFLIMLVPLVVAGAILLLWARRSYPRDVATAVASEENTRQPTSAPAG